MQDQIAELASRLTSAESHEDFQSLDMSIYHVRQDRKAMHERQVNELLKYIADLKERYDAEDDRLAAMARQVEARLAMFADPDFKEAA